MPPPVMADGGMRWMDLALVNQIGFLLQLGHVYVETDMDIALKTYMTWFQLFCCLG